MNTRYFILLLIALYSCDENHKKKLANSFQYGVASGDPKMDGVLLWTHISVKDSTRIVDIKLEIATDSLFKNVIQSESTKAFSKNDHCVKVWIDDLLPDTNYYYYYRFKNKNETSVIGRTQTLPKEVDTVRLAIVNCSKYEGVFFNVYDAISKMDGLNAVVHLGDYIYEDGGGQGAYIPIIKKQEEGINYFQEVLMVQSL